MPGANYIYGLVPRSAGKMSLFVLRHGQLGALSSTVVFRLIINACDLQPCFVTACLPGAVFVGILENRKGPRLCCQSQCFWRDSEGLVKGRF